MTPPDIVFPVRFGERNEELRYALRSLRNVPHGQVWIFGYAPSWVKNVEVVQLKQHRTKHENSLKNLLTACRHSQVSEEFILWNDDMFLLRPEETIPVLHAGLLLATVERRKLQARGPYYRGLEKTFEILLPHMPEGPLDYELHVPLPMRKTGVLEAYYFAKTQVTKLPPALQMRSLHGNLAGLGGEHADDVKVYSLTEAWQPGSLPFLSTTDSMWNRHPAAQYIRDLLPGPSLYERT